MNCVGIVFENYDYVVTMKEDFLIFFLSDIFAFMVTETRGTRSMWLLNTVPTDPTIDRITIEDLFWHASRGLAG